MATFRRTRATEEIRFEETRRQEEAKNDLIRKVNADRVRATIDSRLLPLVTSAWQYQLGQRAFSHGGPHPTPTIADVALVDGYIHGAMSVWKRFESSLTRPDSLNICAGLWLGRRPDSRLLKHDAAGAER